jgi:hypothetical protein
MHWGTDLLETLRRRQEAYGTVAVNETQVYEWHNVFVMAVRVSVAMRPAENRELQQMTQTWSVCAMLCPVID